MEVKKGVGPPKKAKGEKQIGFMVSCKEKNLEIIKPKVKEYIKKLDK